MHFPPACSAVPHPPRALALAARWQVLAATLESTAAIDGKAFEQVLHDVGTGTAPETLELLEALAEASGALAVLVAMRGSGTGPAMAVFPGMRRHQTSDDDQCLRLAAVAVGPGRRAVAVAVAEARTRGDRPSGLPQEPPHWLLADAATEVDAARLLALNIAAGDIAGAPAVLIAAAGDQALMATTETLARQARGLVGIVGGEDALRMQAADALIA